MIRLVGSIVVTLGAFAAISACDDGGGDDGGPNLREIGDPCVLGDQCRYEICLRDVGMCSAPCEPSEECHTDMECGIGPDGSSVCVPRCGLGDLGVGGYACVDGVSTSCEVATDAFCEDCGCPDDLRCSPGRGCLPLSDVGEECYEDDDCRTLNCSAYAQVCRVALGSACTADDCDLCLSWSGGAETSCSRECLEVSECDGDLCAGYEDPFYYVCLPDCSGVGDATCPGSCEPSADSGEYICACYDESCSVEAANRALLMPCADFTSTWFDVFGCAEGLSCIGRFDGGDAGTVDEGYCSKPCASDADCGQGGVCVVLGCPEGSTFECGAWCLPSCTDDIDCAEGPESALCVEIDHVGGGAAPACTTRADLGGGCASGGDCLSGSCVGGTCAPPSGAPSGGA